MGDSYASGYLILRSMKKVRKVFPNAVNFARPGTTVNGIPHQLQKFSKLRNSEIGHRMFGMQRQLDELAKIAHQTDLVMLFLGGNDAGFNKVKRGVKKDTAPDLNEIQPNIEAMTENAKKAYQDILAVINSEEAVAARGFVAKVLVFGYPSVISPYTEFRFHLRKVGEDTRTGCLDVLQCLNDSICQAVNDVHDQALVFIDLTTLFFERPLGTRKSFGSKKFHPSKYGLMKIIREVQRFLVQESDCAVSRAT